MTREEVIAILRNTIPETGITEWLIEAELARREAEARVKELLEEQEKLIWNLGGISTMACSRTPMQYDQEWARAALNDTYKLVADYVELQARVKEMEEVLSAWFIGHLLDVCEVGTCKICDGLRRYYPKEKQP